MKKHIHKLKRVNIGTKDKQYLVYRCTIIHCTAYFPPKLIEGKIVLCNRCNNPMVMNKLALELARPHCQDCVERKNKTVIEDIGQYLEDLDKI